MSSRSRANRSCFVYAPRSILWTIEWLFADANGPRFKVTLPRVPEAASVQDVLRDVLLKRADSCPQLRSFTESWPRLQLLLRHELKTRFRMLDRGLSLAQALVGASIVDFPSIVVVFPEHAHRFPLLLQQQPGTRQQQQATQSDRQTVKTGKRVRRAKRLPRATQAGHLFQKQLRRRMASAHPRTTTDARVLQQTRGMSVKQRNKAWIKAVDGG